MLDVVKRLSPVAAFISFSFAIFLVAVGLMILSHENSHVQNFGSRGMEAEVVFDLNNLDMPAYTFSGDPCYVECDTLRLSHNITDAIGYHLIPMFIGLSTLIVLAALYIKNG